MVLVNKISKEELYKIGEAFRDYKYEDSESGLFYCCKSDEMVKHYIMSFAKAGVKSRMVYTLENNEGYIMIKLPKNKLKISSIFTLLKGIIKSMGVKGAKQFLNDIKNAGESLESKLKKKKQKFITIEMLVVKKEFQNQGYMRKLLEFAISKSKKYNLPIILSTDGKLKLEKYRHFGFELEGIRKFKDNVFEYDLIRWEDKI